MVNQLESVFDISAEADKAVSGGNERLFFFCQRLKRMGIIRP